MNEQNEPDAAAQIEQLLMLCKHLQQQVENSKTDNAALREQVENLKTDNTALREQLAAAVSQTERLTAIVDAEAEDLQQFGSHWFRPSAVVSVTRDNSLGVLINGSPIGWSASSMRGDATDQEMQAIAEEINRQNAEKRARARQG